MERRVQGEAEGEKWDRKSSYSLLGEAEGEKLQRPIGRSASYSKFRHLVEGHDCKSLDVPVVVVSSEVDPWSKSGGLGIIAGAYGYEFAMKGHRTMVISPMYDDYSGVSWLADKDITVFGQAHTIKYFHMNKVHDETQGFATDYIFIQHSCFRRMGGLYHDKNGEYGDNLFRFALFSLAALEAPLCCHLNGSAYGDRVLFLANDWQSGLLPIYLSHKFRRHGTYVSARCIFVVHNMGYQGVYPWDRDHLGDLGLPEACRNDLFFVYPEHMRTHGLDKGECINLTKAAVITSDRVLTVSKNYASEIQTPEGGYLLDECCRSKGIYLTGIQNGIEDTWDPSTDRNIAAKFSSGDLSGKAVCKRALQESLGLELDDGAALLGFVGRLTWQKGVDILQKGVVDWLMHDSGNGATGRVQLIIMGQGDEPLQDWLRQLEHMYPKRLCGYVGFDPKVERKMIAGCDFLLMPSRYEPCGIPQMLALAYGTVPVVHATGGLKDSVVDAGAQDPAVLEEANGYYVLPLTPDKMKEVLYLALKTYHQDNTEHLRLMRNGMACDFYWPRAIDEYETNFDYALAEAPLYKI